MNIDLRHLPSAERRILERAMHITRPASEHKVFVCGTFLTGGAERTMGALGAEASRVGERDAPRHGAGLPRLREGRDGQGLGRVAHGR